MGILNNIFVWILLSHVISMPVLYAEEVSRDYDALRLQGSPVEAIHWLNYFNTAVILALLIFLTLVIISILSQSKNRNGASGVNKLFIKFSFSKVDSTSKDGVRGPLKGYVSYLSPEEIHFITSADNLSEGDTIACDFSQFPGFPSVDQDIHRFVIKRLKKKDWGGEQWFVVKARHVFEEQEEKEAKYLENLNLYLKQLTA